jgi:hypothetical protein
LTSRPGAQRCKVWLLHEEGCKPDEVPSIFSLEEKLNALIVAAGITPSKKFRSKCEVNICPATAVFSEVTTKSRVLMRNSARISVVPG